MPVEFVIVRHGDPAAAGVEDPGLSDLGRRQAEATARHLAEQNNNGLTIDALYVSPLRRAAESAAPLAELLGLDPVVEDRVAEYDHGSVYYSEKHTEQMGDETAMSVIERLQSPDFRARVVEGFDAIAAANPDGRVAVVCHGGVISIMVSAAVYNESLMFLPEYGSITRVNSHGGGLRNLVAYNEASWLAALPSDEPQPPSLS